MTHESTLSAALLLEAGLNLLSSIYASKGLCESMLAERERTLNGWFDGSTLHHSLGRRWEGPELVKATSTNCVIDHCRGQ